MKAARGTKPREFEAAGGKLIEAFNHGMCDSLYHLGLYFECADRYDYGIRVFYLPNRTVYYVIGKARVLGMPGKPFGQEVEDGEIAAPGPARKVNQ